MRIPWRSGSHRAAVLLVAVLALVGVGVGSFHHAHLRASTVDSGSWEHRGCHGHRWHHHSRTHFSHIGMSGRVATVTAKSDGHVTVQTADGWTKALTVNDQTRVYQGRDARSLNDVQVGQPVLETDQLQADGTWVATSLFCLGQPLPPVTATFTAPTHLQAGTVTSLTLGNDLWLRWLGFGGLLVSLAIADRKRRRRRRCGKED